MSHPDPSGPADLTPVEIGEVWENPVTRERATILELPHTNPEGRVVAELTALVGARVVGEHRHPAIVERFTALEGELTVKLDGQTSILREGETAVIEPGVWHDWWNASDQDARVRVEITPGERFAHMIETMFGLARLGHTNAKGMPNPLQLALFAREFSDVIVFRSPPPRFSAHSSARSPRSRAGAAIARPTRKSHARCWRREHKSRPAVTRGARARGPASSLFNVYTFLSHPRDKARRADARGSGGLPLRLGRPRLASISRTGLLGLPSGSFTPLPTPKAPISYIGASRWPLRRFNAPSDMPSSWDVLGREARGSAGGQDRR